MAFHGDISSFGVPDLLQWLEGSRKTGTLALARDSGERKIFVLSGQIVAAAAPGLWERIARTLVLAQIADGAVVRRKLAELGRSHSLAGPANWEGIDPEGPASLAKEELLGLIADLTSDRDGRFHWTEDVDRGGEEWVPLEWSLRELLFEALRWIDEWPEVERTLAKDSLIVRSLVAPSPEQTFPHRIVLGLCQKGETLGKLRLAVGLSRLSVLRRVYDLLRLGWVKVEGAGPVELDPMTEMLEKGSVLVREKQFDAAGMVFASLLASDPSDRRVREFVRMVEREHIAALYEELPPVKVFKLVEDRESLGRLKPEERQIASLVNGSWDVSTIVLASSARELETLKCLSKLARRALLVPVGA